MSIRANLRNGSYEWLTAILLSWWIPFQLFGTFKVRYWVSLLLWGVPLFFLFPRFLRATHRGSRRRQAVLAAALYVFGAGVALDFCFGATILGFDKCPPGTAYLECLPAIGGQIPIEEYLFYILGGFAVVLVYVWADMHWLAAYNVRQRHGLIPAPGHLIEWSPRVAMIAVLVMAAGIAWKLYYTQGKPMERWMDVIPFYYTFLVFFAFIPLIAMYRGVKDFVNWRAFSFTGLYVMLTAAVWEVTLGLPGLWWFYQADAMIGKKVQAWSTVKPYPIEALFVWVAVVFVGVFFYEFWETYYYDTRPPFVKLFTGTFPPPTPPPPPDPAANGISVVVNDDAHLATRTRGLRQVVANGRLDDSAFELVVSAGEEWRSAGARDTRYPTICFVGPGLTVTPRALRSVREVLESPRIVGGSTTAVPDTSMLRRLLCFVRSLPKAWLTGFDRGILFCRRIDFDAMPFEVRDGTSDAFLRWLRGHGRRSKRVLTRVVTDGVVALQERAAGDVPFSGKTLSHS